MLCATIARPYLGRKKPDSAHMECTGRDAFNINIAVISDENLCDVENLFARPWKSGELINPEQTQDRIFVLFANPKTDC